MRSVKLVGRKVPAYTEEEWGASVHACEMGDYALVAAKNQDGTAQLIVVGPDFNSVLIADSYSAAILILLRLRILIAAKGQ